MQTALASIATLLLGLLIGHVLTVTRERHKWLVDQKKEEYRELIDMLYETISVVTEERPGLAQPVNAKVFNEAVKKLARMFEDRIFIAKQLKQFGIHSQWMELKKMISYDSQLESVTPLEMRYSTMGVWRKEDALRERIIQAANEDMVALNFFQ